MRFLTVSLSSLSKALVHGLYHGERDQARQLDPALVNTRDDALFGLRELLLHAGHQAVFSLGKLGGENRSKSSLVRSAMR